MIATNTLEIKDHGFAFGQISDMEAWYAELSAPGGPLENQRFAVTGYSLGGHLATAFNLLHGSAGGIREVVTFNGAGVGTYAEGTDLRQLLTRFDERRGDYSGFIADSHVRDLYLRVRADVAAGRGIAFSDGEELRAIAAGTSGLNYDAAARTAAQNVLGAVANVQGIRGSVEHVANVQSGNGSRPVQWPETSITQANLDYQMAMLDVSGSTDSASLVAGAVRAFRGSVVRNPGGLAPQYDVVGATTPSAVANSQWHVGQPVAVFIEDQPLYRGGYIGGALSASLGRLSVELLTNNYEGRSFGDTHSLVLLVDSLSVQNALVQLLPPERRAAAAATLSSILREASFLRMRNGDAAFGNDQGRAEGDVLENVVNALADLVLGPDASRPRLTGSADGNTWWDIAGSTGNSGREALHALLQQITSSDNYTAIANSGVSLTRSGASLRDSARNDFGAFIALHTLSPFAFTGLTSSPGTTWSDIYAAWNNDRNLTADQQASGGATFSDTYLADRANLLDRRNWYSAQNVDPVTLQYAETAGESPYLNDGTYFEDAASRLRITQGADPASLPHATRQFYFGDVGANSYAGGSSVDHLYGGAGNDSLSGAGDADHLEGNADNDALDGGGGNDTLLGGQGNDTYRFSGVWDNDVVIDADGSGSLVVEGIGTLTGAGTTRGSANSWQTADGSVRYALVSVGAGRNDMVITVNRAGTQGTIVVRGWSEQRAVGITSLAPQTEQQPYRLTDNNDLTSQNQSDTAAAHIPDGVTVVEAGDGHDLVVASDTNSDSRAFSLYGQAGNDLLYGSRGDDIIDGGEGNDYLVGNQGSDVIYGGEGNDIILPAGSRPSVRMPSGQATGNPPPTQGQIWADAAPLWSLRLVGQPGSRTVYIPGRTVRIYAPLSIIDGGYSLSVGASVSGNDTAPDMLFGGSGDDYIVGNRGDDVISGDADNDVLLGGSGNDMIYGGSGIDELSGDEGDDIPAATLAACGSVSASAEAGARSANAEEILARCTGWASDLMHYRPGPTARRNGIAAQRRFASEIYQ